MSTSVVPPDLDRRHAGCRSAAVNASTSEFVDLSRWGAAFLVVFSHVRSLVLTNYGAIVGHPTLLTKAIYFVAGLGHMAVVVFFVISGFLVGGRTIIKAANGRYIFADYAIHRIVRIYIVFLPALMLGFLLDKLGYLYFDTVGIYANHPVFHIWSVDYAIANRLGLTTILGNLAMLQTILVHPLGSNGPLWSLANEWWYYVVFACGLSAWWYSERQLRAACLVAMVVLLGLLPLSITLWFTIWLLGAGVAVLERRWRGWPALVGMAMFVLVMATERVILQHMGSAGTEPTMWLQFLLDFVLALGFSLALLCAGNGRWSIGRLHPFLASFSYTVYLVHFPAMVFLAAMSAQVIGFGIGEQPFAPALAFMAALIAVLYLCACGVACITEWRTQQVRNWLYRQVGARGLALNVSGKRTYAGKPPVA